MARHTCADRENTGMAQGRTAPALRHRGPAISRWRRNPYGLAVLRNQLDILRAARVGERNHTLNRCAFIVGRFIHTGHLDETFGRQALESVAVRIGLSVRETTDTLRSALRAAT
jgi:hypothetical protein